MTKKPKKYEEKLQNNSKDYNFPTNNYLNVLINSDSQDLYVDVQVLITSKPIERIKGLKLFSSPIYLIDNSRKKSFEEDFKISFVFYDNPLKLIQFLQSKKKNEISSFFSIGLASVIIITDCNYDLVEVLGDFSIFIKEEWSVIDGKLHNSITCLNTENNTEGHVQFRPIPENIPIDIGFMVREFQRVSLEILDKAEDYSQYAFSRLLKLILHFSNKTLIDLYYILDDDNQYPESELFKEYEKLNLSNDDLISKKNEMKSDTISLLVQIYSSLNYINNQYFSGISPILNNSGQIGEFNLLGVGSAVRGLFVMLDNLEIFLTSTKLETLDDEKLLSIKFNGEHTLGFNQSTDLNPELWRQDPNFATYQIEIGKVETKETAFSRIGYYSARLGFKEYRYFATSALQVLISAASNEWSLVNYTHEIIHGHVRYLLQHILQDVDLAKVHTEWGQLKNDLHKLKNKAYNVKELGQIAITNYLDFSTKLGSLSKNGFNSKSLEELQKPYSSFSNFEIDNGLNSQYWEVNEIFVHSLDFFYIYKSNYQIYIRSIWLSWITQPAVVKDPTQYLLRSLLVISLNIPGKPHERLALAIFKLSEILSELITRSSVFKQFLEELQKYEKDNSFYMRFYNCLTLADFSFQFLTSPNTEELINGDDNVLKQVGDYKDETAPFIYDTEINDWPYTDVKSKFYYILENTHKSIVNFENVTNMEYLSSRLLLIISST